MRYLLPLALLACVPDPSEATAVRPDGDTHPACAVFDDACTACHGGGSGLVDLRPENLGQLLGVKATTAPDLDLIAVGDPDASFLVHKIEGDLAAGQGSRMPLGGELGAQQIADIRSFIEAGDLSCEEGQGIRPGGPIDVGDPPCGSSEHGCLRIGGWRPYRYAACGHRRAGHLRSTSRPRRSSRPARPRTGRTGRSRCRRCA